MTDQPTNVVVTADTKNYQQEMGAGERATQSMLESVVRLSSALGELNRRAGHKIEMIGAGTAAGLAGASAMAARFQQQMSQLEAQAVLTNRSFDQTVRSTNQLRRDFGLTTSEIVSLVSQLNKMGQANNDVGKIAAAFIKLGAVTGESIPGLVDGLVSLQRQMGTTGAQQTEKYASALATLSSNAGVSATSILQFANAIAPVGKVAGMTQTEIMGVSTAFNKAGADGYSAANAFNKMLTDITRSIQYGSPELAAYSNLIGKNTDEFRKMSKTEAVTQIFEQINAQGPDAIKTLERFGLDGIRTYRALQAVAQGGGIRQSVADATKGYQDTTQFTNAAETALDGLTEAGQKLRNVLSQIGEAFGKGLLTPLTWVTNAITAVLTPLAKLMQGLGNIPGLFTAMGAAATMGVGMAVTHLGKLLALGGLRQAGAGFPVRGFQAGLRANDMEFMSDRVANARESYEAGRGGRLQRAAYNFGNIAGLGVGRIRDAFTDSSNDPEGISAAQRARLALRRGVNATTGMVTDFLGSQLEPLRMGNQEDVFNRRPAFSGARSAEFYARQDNILKQANKFSNQTGMSSAVLAGAMENSQAFKQSTASIKENMAAHRASTGVLKNAINEVGRLGRDVGAAGLGAGAMGMRAVGGMAWRGAKALGGAASDFLGGPLGMALAGGTAFMALKGNIDAGREEAAAAAKEQTDMNTAGGVYRAALGEAARATTTFADVVRANAGRISGTDTFSGQIGPQQIAKYQESKNTAQYTDARVGTMSDAQLKLFAQSSFMTPKQQELFAYDLLKRTGGNAQKAQEYLNLTQGGGSMDLSQLYSGMSGTDLFGRMTSESNQATSTATSIRGDVMAELGKRGGITEQSRYFVANVNALIKGNKDNNYTQTFESLAQLSGASSEDERNAISRLVTLNTDLRGRGTNVPQEVYQYLQERKQRGELTAPEQRILDAYSQSGYKGDSLFTTNYQMPQALTNQPFAMLSSNVLAGARGSSLGTMFQGNNSVLEKALNETGNQNAGIIAMREMADSAIALKGGFSDAIGGLQELKSAAGDASDPLYQLANAAEQEVRRRQAYEMNFMTQGQQITQLRSNYLASSQSARANPNAPGVQEQLQSDKAAYEQAQLGAFERLKAITLQYRQLQMSQKYALEDFNISRGRAEEDFYRSRSRQEADFYRQRERSEAAYNRQVARANRDYVRQREYAYYDFNKQRIRSEEDFNHQIEVMTRQAAKNLYDIYNRINVQRTWDAANLLSNVQEQNQRLAEQQANLDKLRKMGISGDVISMMGLNDPQNAQQLARMVDDLLADPSLIKKFNDAIQGRMDAAKQVVTDEDNDAWKEMQRSFDINLQRSIEDFNLSMKRQAQAFATSLADQRSERTIMMQEQMADYRRMRAQQLDEFNRSMARQAEDYGRSIRRANEMFTEAATDLNDQIFDLSQAALSALRGDAKAQFAALLTEVKLGKTKIFAELNSGLPIFGSWMKLLSSAIDLTTSTGGGTGGGSRVTTANAPITSGYGKRGSGFHYGVDLGVPSGSPVYSYKAGKVIDTGYQAGGFGNLIRVDHGGGLYTIYGHLSKIGVREGQAVAQGQRMGSTGNTGNSTGPHLHYEVRKGNAYGTQYAINPMPYLLRSQGGGVYGRMLGDKVPMLAEAGEYVIPKFRARELGWSFFDNLRANGLAGVKNALVASQSVPQNASGVQNFYSKVDKSTTFSGPITVQANDTMKLKREMEQEKRMKQLTGAR